MKNSHDSEDEHFCLKWSEYNHNLTSVFGELLQRETLVDVSISTDSGKTLKCHRIVLSASSDYFQKLFMDSVPGLHFVVILQDVPWRILLHIIEYMYRGQINVAAEDIGPLLRSARVLQIRGLVDLIAPLGENRSEGKLEEEQSGLRKRRRTSSILLEDAHSNYTGKEGDKSSKLETISDMEDIEDVKEEMLEVTPGIMEIEQGLNGRGQTSTWMTTRDSSRATNQPTKGNLDKYENQLQSLLQKYADPEVEPGSAINSTGSNRERGPNKSWSPDTMAQAIWSVLEKGFSLNRAARSHDIPYPTFALYANRVHNMLGPSSTERDPNELDLRPKGRGRPQRILKGNWPENQIKQVIQAVVFRKHVSGPVNSTLPSVSQVEGTQEYSRFLVHPDTFEDADENLNTSGLSTEERSTYNDSIPDQRPPGSVFNPTNNYDAATSHPQFTNAYPHQS